MNPPELQFLPKTTICQPGIFQAPGKTSGKLCEESRSAGGMEKIELVPSPTWDL